MKIFKNCSILTMDDNIPYADYMIVDNGIIVELGKGTPEKSYKYAEVFDLKGKTVVPGFWESHMHIVDGMRSHMELNLRDCQSLDHLEEKISQYCSGLSEGDWVIGHGWDESILFEGQFPDRHLLDKLCSSHPMVLIRMDGHSLCANSAAIEAMGLDNGQKSSSSAMFFEDAASDITKRLAENFSEGYIEKVVLKAQEEFLKNGITSVNDICVGCTEYFDIYRRLQAEGKLKIRITVSPYGLEKACIEGFEEKKAYCTDSLRVGPPKYFMDGSFGSRTAFLTEDYEDEPGNRGLKLISDRKLYDIAEENAEQNRSIAVHAIGDQAVSCVLDALGKVDFRKSKVLRNRIEHIQIVKPQDIQRFGRLSVTASFQPNFLYEVDLTLKRMGKRRMDNMYRFKSFIKEGVNVIFNSDWPYGGGAFPRKPGGNPYIGFEPILGIHAACCRQMNESEAVEPAEALRCYTANAAYVNYRENELGKLKRGYFADFSVLSDNILSCEKEEIINIEVLMTVISGEVVYEKK